MSSPMHLIFCQGITMSLALAKMFSSLVLPGTIIDVMVSIKRVRLYLIEMLSKVAILLKKINIGQAIFSKTKLDMKLYAR